MINQVKQILEDNKQTSEIGRSVEHDIRMSFYNDRLNEKDTNFYKVLFVEKIENKLSNARSIDSLNLNIDYPFEINSFTADIREKLSEIWNGQNKSIQANFKKEAKEISLNIEFYKYEVFDLYFKKPNTLIYLEHDGEEIKPKFIYSHQIKAFKKKSKNIFEWVIFRINNLIYYIDNSQLTTFVIKENDYNTLRQKGKPIKLEGIDVCPIFHISNELYNINSDFVRTNIFSNHLSKLDLLQELYFYKKMINPFAFNLIVEKYRNTKCKYKTENEYCDNGYLYTETDNNEILALTYKGSRKRCPVCNKKVSPGMEVLKSETFSLDKPEIISNVVNYISPDTSILEYSDKFIEKFEENISDSILGKSKEIKNNQNRNELSVLSSVNEKLTILLSLKTKFEDVIKNIENVKANWLHSGFEFWTINLGTDFLLSDIKDLYNELEYAKLNNLVETKNIQNQIIATKYATDPISKKRNLILLEFYPNIDLKAENIPEKLKLKQTLFDNFISFYENKYGNIGVDNSLRNKIIIKLDKEFDLYYESINKINT